MALNGSGNTGTRLGMGMGMGFRSRFNQPSPSIAPLDIESQEGETLLPLAENRAKTTAAREAASAPPVQIEFGTTSSTHWPEPDAVDEQLPPVPEFDLRLLPEALRPIVEDAADRMQVPIDFPAVTSVMCLAGAVNRRAVIQPKRADYGWTVVPNLWGGIVASPGQKKSPCISAVTAPLRAIECVWRTEQQEALADYEMQAEEAELAISAWRDGFKRAAKGKGEKPERPTFDAQRPIAKRLITSDGTFEAIHSLLVDNPAGLFVLRDELTGWLASLDRYGREEQRAFYLEAWNGDSGFTVDRIGRGSVHVEHCCISLFGGIQPSRLRSYLAEALADGPSNDGLIQRFQLLVWPDPQPSWTYHDRAPSVTARERAECVFRRLTAMDGNNPKRFKFDDSAQELFVLWLTKLARRIVEEIVSRSLPAFNHWPDAENFTRWAIKRCTSAYYLQAFLPELLMGYSVWGGNLEVTVTAQAQGQCLGRLHREQARPHSSTHAHRAAPGESRVNSKPGEGGAAAPDATKVRPLRNTRYGSKTR